MAILIVEDDAFYATRLAEMLGDEGAEALFARSAEDALSVKPELYDAAIIDTMLPNDPGTSGITAEESRAGFLAGVAVARRIRKNQPNTKLLLITSYPSGSECEGWANEHRVPLVLKGEGPRAVRDALREAGILKGKSAPRAFIVHGHDEAALLELKNYIQNALHWPEPIVLREQPNLGRTLIEKFEDHAGQIDCVFVLLTPDDTAASRRANDRRRSRQNVTFELGFFYAQMGRHSGRVIALYKGPNELPSDIQGIAWISIDKGVEAAGEEIRREVAHLNNVGNDGRAADNRTAAL